MALEFYYVDDKRLNSMLFSLNDKEFEALNPVTLQLKKLTGTIIDQYGKTIIHYDHVQLIVKLIDLHRTLPNTGFKSNELMLSIKEKLASVNADLVAIGD